MYWLKLPLTFIYTFIVPAGTSGVMVVGLAGSGVHVIMFNADVSIAQVEGGIEGGVSL